ncbi:hypothetical protein B0H14DRAFT_2789077 [Mycena olivaceomarginata]|nr:hypothetical protein B0H14DRAFT_2789077 [Mycena olivaceomarginata]
MRSAVHTLATNFLLVGWGRIGPSHSLDSKHRCAVNLATNKVGFNLLENVLAGCCDHEFDPAPLEENRELDYEPILPENIYSMEESGFPALSSRKEKVIGGASL